MLAEEWSAFAEIHKPTPMDTNLYSVWYAIARQDYNETMMSLQECTREAAISRTSADVPFHLQGLMQGLPGALTFATEDRRATALHIMLNHRDPDKASIQELMMRVLVKYAQNKLHEDSLQSQKKDVPLAGLEARERTTNETSSDRCDAWLAGVTGWAGGFLSSCSAGRTDRPTRNGLAFRCQMMGRRLSQLCSAGRTDHRELPEVPGVQQGTRS
jgi:hypothetical protein